MAEQAVSAPSTQPTVQTNPTVDQAYSKMMAHIETGVPQDGSAQPPSAEGVPAQPPVVPAQDGAPSAKPADSKPVDELTRLRRQTERQQKEWQLANQAQAQKYEAQLREQQTRIAALEARLQERGAGRQEKPPADPKVDSFQEELRRYMQEQHERQSQMEKKLQERIQADEAKRLYSEWESGAKTVVQKDDYSALREFCELEGIDPVAEMARYTQGIIQQRGIAIDPDAAAEDLNEVARQKLEKYRSRFASQTGTQQSIQKPTIPGTGGIPAPGVQSTPRTQEDALGDLVKHYEQQGFFRQV